MQRVTGRRSTELTQSGKAKNPTIVDVASQAGVSTATVSRVLNGISTVDSELVERVQAAIQATGYVPNGAGRALRRQKVDTWAAIVPDIGTPFFTSVVGAIESVADEHGYSVILCNTDKRIERQQHYISMTIGDQISGVVLAPTASEDIDLSPFREAGIPVVLIDGAPTVGDADTVLMDNRLAGELVARHLLAQGLTRPSCIAGDLRVRSTEDRLRGFADTFADAGYALPESRVCRTNLRADAAEIAARSLLLSSDKPDAVFAVNGPATVGAYRALRALGIQMPSEVALVGTDDDIWTNMVTPEVTVVQQPVQRIGRLAGELLLSRSRGERGEAHRIVLLPTLIPRASSMRI